MRRPSLLLLLALGCDLPDRVEGLERVNATLEDGVLAANAELEDLRADLETARSEADDARAERDSLEARVIALEGALARIEEDAAKPAPAPTLPSAATGRHDPADRYAVRVGEAASRGPEDAKVTIVVLTDFQCPFCKRVQPTLRALERKYAGDVRMVVKHNPLAMHRRARAAALAAEAAHEQDRFWELHDRLYDTGLALSERDLVTLAKDAGCDASRFRADIRGPVVARRVDADMALAKRVGARGTPSFFINGRYLAGAQPQSAFERVIDEEIVEADRRIAGGTPQDLLYESFMRGAKTSP